MKTDKLDRIFSGFSSVTVGTLSLNLILILFHPILVRKLGPTVYGRIAVVMSVYSLLSHMALFGMKEAVRKLMPETDNRDELASYSILIMGFIGLFVPFLAYIAIKIFSQNIFGYKLTGLLLLVLPAIFFNNLDKSLRSILYSIHREKESEILKIIRNVFYYSVAILIALIGLDPAYIIIWFSLAPVFTIVIGYYRVKKLLKISINNSFRGRKLFASKMFSYSSIMLVAVFFTQIYLYVDIILLNQLLGESIAGLYRATVVPANLIMIFAGIIRKTGLHNFSHINNSGSPKELNQVLNLFLRYLSLLIIPFTITIFFFSKDILSVFYGPGYTQASMTLRILAVAVMFSAIAEVFGTFLEATSNLVLSAMISGVTALLNVVLNILLIPAIGMQGAALATLVSYIFLLLSYLYVSRKNVKLKSISIEYTLRFLIVLFTLILSIFVGMKLNLSKYINLFLLAPTSLLLYFLLAWNFELIKKSDKNRIYSLIE